MELSNVKLRDCKVVITGHRCSCGKSYKCLTDLQIHRILNHNKTRRKNYRSKIATNQSSNNVVKVTFKLENTIVLVAHVDRNSIKSDDLYERSTVAHPLPTDSAAVATGSATGHYPVVLEDDNKETKINDCVRAKSNCDESTLDTESRHIKLNNHQNTQCELEMKLQDIQLSPTPDRQIRSIVCGDFDEYLLRKRDDDEIQICYDSRNQTQEELILENDCEVLLHVQKLENGDLMKNVDRCALKDNTENTSTSVNFENSKDENISSRHLSQDIESCGIPAQNIEYSQEMIQTNNGETSRDNVSATPSLTVRKSLGAEKVSKIDNGYSSYDETNAQKCSCDISFRNKHLIEDCQFSTSVNNLNESTCARVVPVHEMYFKKRKRSNNPSIKDGVTNPKVLRTCSFVTPATVTYSTATSPITEVCVNTAPLSVNLINKQNNVIDGVLVTNIHIQNTLQYDDQYLIIKKPADNNVSDSINSSRRQLQNFGREEGDENYFYKPSSQEKVLTSDLHTTPEFRSSSQNFENLHSDVPSSRDNIFDSILFKSHVGNSIIKEEIDLTD